jgi:ABC-2 type transport system permease protein
MNAVAELTQSRELLVNLTLRDLRGKYKRSLLGWSWSLLNPLSTLVIYALVFGYLLKIKPDQGANGLENFPAFLLCGLLPWNFLSGALNGCMGSLIGNAGLIKKVYFPRELLPFATVLSLDVSFVIEMGVLSVFMLYLGNMVLPWMLPALVLMALLTCFAAGLGLVFAVFNVYFRDVQYLVGILLNLWFYLTPIVYPIKYVTDFADAHDAQWVVTVYRANPMVGFTDAFRDLFYNLQFPQIGTLAYITAWSLGALAVGMVVFGRFQGRLAEEL